MPTYSPHDWHQLSIKCQPASDMDVKALLRAALTRREWESVGIAEDEKGYGFTAPVATMQRIYRLLGLTPPHEWSAGLELVTRSKAESPTVVGFEPPRAAVGAPVQAMKLRRVVVVPVKASAR